jgi:hypothetical protein
VQWWIVHWVSELHDHPWNSLHQPLLSRPFIVSLEECVLKQILSMGWGKIIPWENVQFFINVIQHISFECRDSDMDSILSSSLYPNLIRNYYKSEHVMFNEVYHSVGWLQHVRRKPHSHYFACLTKTSRISHDGPAGLRWRIGTFLPYVGYIETKK